MLFGVCVCGVLFVGCVWCVIVLCVCVFRVCVLCVCVCGVRVCLCVLVWCAWVCVGCVCVCIHLLTDSVQTQGTSNNTDIYRHELSLPDLLSLHTGGADKSLARRCSKIPLPASFLHYDFVRLAVCS